jgi:hypothetical protein
VKSKKVMLEIGRYTFRIAKIGSNLSNAAIKISII